MVLHALVSCWLLGNVVTCPPSDGQVGWFPGDGSRYLMALKATHACRPSVRGDLQAQGGSLRGPCQARACLLHALSGQRVPGREPRCTGNISHFPPDGRLPCDSQPEVLPTDVSILLKKKQNTSSIVFVHTELLSIRPRMCVCVSSFPCVCWPSACLLPGNVYSVLRPLFEIGLLFCCC